MIEELSKIDFLNVIENERIIDSKIIKVSTTIKDSNYKSIGLDLETMVKSALSNEIMAELIREIRRNLFEQSEILEEYYVDSESADMIDDLNADKYLLEIRNNYFNKIFNPIKELDEEFKFLISNGKIMSFIMDCDSFNPGNLNNRIVERAIASAPYKIGFIYNISLFSDPFMDFYDNEILFGCGKINLESNGKINFNGLDQIERFKEIIIDDKISHREIDPFGEEDWTTGLKYYISATTKYKISFDKIKIKKMKIIDENDLLF